jgi:hypothetical protein
MVHLLNEHWKNDVMIKKDSGKTYQLMTDLLELIDHYGLHTLEMHFKNTNSLQRDEIP